jgi:hypothetical protein
MSRQRKKVLLPPFCAQENPSGTREQRAEHIREQIQRTERNEQREQNKTDPEYRELRRTTENLQATENAQRRVESGREQRI